MDIPNRSTERIWAPARPAPGVITLCLLPLGLLASTACARVESGRELPDEPTESSWAEFLQGLPCETQAGALLASWGATDGAVVAPPVPGLVGRLRIPTERLGHWVLVDRASGEPPALTTVSPDSVARVSFDSACTASASSTRVGAQGHARPRTPTSAQPPGRDGHSPVEPFTDADLRASVAVGPTVVYVWSPHMPLSVDGYAEISVATQALGLHLMPVLFVGGDAAFAASEAARVGIPTDGLREMASIELEFRDAQVHAPSVLLFHGDRVSPVLPGYRDADGYREFLAAFLGGSIEP